MEENPYLRQLVPHTAQRRRFQPVEGGFITLSLPGEKVMATVRGIVSEDDIVVKLDGTPMMAGKSHSYQRGEFVPCRRKIDDLGIECWVAVPEHELTAEVARERLEEMLRQRAAEEARSSKPAAAETMPPVAPGKKKPNNKPKIHPPAAPAPDNWSA